MSPGFLAGLLGCLGLPLAALWRLPGRTSHTRPGVDLPRYAPRAAGALPVLKKGAHNESNGATHDEKSCRLSAFLVGVCCCGARGLGFVWDVFSVFLEEARTW